mmetsp:Transcript_57537/g.135396  ORF Transcript_57537/g.135396 Transcript_57537/m.135396 type:complete len:202 (+) Transcript_57537:509-1114(+)
MDHFGRTPHRPLSVLFLAHFFQYRHQPLLKLAVIVVWHKQVANSVQSLRSESVPFECEVAVESWGHALDKVFLDAARGGDDAVHHFVLCEVADHFSGPTARHVRRVAQKDGAFDVLSNFRILELLDLVLGDGLITQAPGQHLVHLLDGVAEARCLETGGFQRRKEFVVVDAVVEIVAGDGITFELRSCVGLHDCSRSHGGG